MPEEYIMSSKACVYVLGGAHNTAGLYDFDGVYILDGGFGEKTTGFVAHVRNVSAVLLSAPTANNLGTTGALLAQGKPLPVFTNVSLKGVKGAAPKAGTSGEQVKAIEEANAKLLSVHPPLFTPKYTPLIIYQSADKGILSLYILAGDAKDGEAIAKSLLSGNEAEVAKAAAEHGTIGVLLWRPAIGTQPAVRVLISGTSSAGRIQQALDKAARALPFLNAPVVKSKDALSDIPAPAVPRPSAAGTGKPLARPGAAPRTAPPTRAAPAARAAPPARAAPATTTRTQTRPTTAAPTTTTTRTRAAPAPAAPARKPVAPSRGAEPALQKKTVGKVQGAAPSKAAPAKPAAAPIKKPVPPATSAPKVEPKVVEPPKEPTPPPVVVIEEPVAAEPSGAAEPQLDIVIIPPTPEPPRMEEPEPEPAVPKEEKPDDVEPEIPAPVDAFKEPTPEPVAAPAAPEPVYPSLDDVVPEPSPLIDIVDPIVPPHPEPSAPAVPSDHVIISTDDPLLPDIAAAVPFVPHVVPAPKDEGLITLEGDEVHVAPGFEEPLIPQAPREDGTLADCSEDVSKLVTISMDTDKTAPPPAAAIGEVTQLASDLKDLALDEKTEDYVRKLSNQMIEDASLPFTSALASSIVGAITTNGGDTNGVNGHHHQEQEHRGADHPEPQDTPKEASKHDLMQSRSSVIEQNGAPVEYEKTDPAIDDILAACANESDKLDANVSHHSETLHMPPIGAGVAPKPVKFARPYYFDVATVPRNEKLETSVGAEALGEFVAKIRARNLILASRDISGEQLQAILTGKQTWADAAHPCTIIPTHSSPTLLDFRQRHEEASASAFLSWAIPVEKQRTTVSSEAGAVEYELARVSLE